MERSASQIRRTRLERAYKFVVEHWATDTNEVADALYGGSVDRAARDLRLLSRKGLIVGTDVNDAAQGMLRSGSYKSLTWQSYYDIENSDQAETLAAAAHDFREAFPPAKSKATTRKTTNKKEATMAAQTKSKGGVQKRSAAKSKPAAKAPEAKANGGRKRAEVSAETVKQIKQLREAGASWDKVREETGVNAIKGRKLLAQHGGATVTVKAKSGEALAKELAAHRAEGVAWYTLAAATGKTEAEVKALAEQGGASTEGRVYHKSEPKAKPAAKAKAKAKPAAKRGSGAAGRKIAAARRAKAKADKDPSPQA